MRLGAIKRRIQSAMSVFGNESKTLCSADYGYVRMSESLVWLTFVVWAFAVYVE